MCPDIRLGNQGQQGQGPEGREEMQLVGVEERRGQELCYLGWQGRLWRRGLGAGGGRVWTCGDGYRDYRAGKSRPSRGEGKGLEMQEPVQGKLGGSLSGKYILEDEQEKVNLGIRRGVPHRKASNARLGSALLLQDGSELRVPKGDLRLGVKV